NLNIIEFLSKYPPEVIDSIVVTAVSYFRNILSIKKITILNYYFKKYYTVCILNRKYIVNTKFTIYLSLLIIKEVKEV
ncbi:hypothetical protein EDB80DRAFT_577897, partial [Ilyonectria destructans]